MLRIDVPQNSLQDISRSVFASRFDRSIRHVSLQKEGYEYGVKSSCVLYLQVHRRCGLKHGDGEKQANVGCQIGCLLTIQVGQRSHTSCALLSVKSLSSRLEKAEKSDSLGT